MIISTIYLIFITVIFGIITVVIFERKNPVKIVAWIIPQLVLPILGFVLYIFFGQDKRRKLLISRRRFNQIKRFWENNQFSVEQLLKDKSLIQLASMIEKNFDAKIYDGSSIRIFTDGKSKFESLIHHLEGANSHIHLQYYIFEDDEIGNRIRDILIQKAKEGVEVRVIYDDLGCWKVKKHFFKEMEEAGILVSRFLPVVFKLLTSRINYRNHRKIVVIDGRIGYIGGMNIADRYINGNYLGMWRDTHILIEGKGAQGLQSSFVVDWFFSERKLLTQSEYFPHIQSKGDVKLQVLPGGPFSSWHELMMGIYRAITSATRYIYIQTPYFLPTESFLISLQVAAMSGVDVRIMVPAESDTWMTSIGTQAYYADVLTAGVKIFEYAGGFIHAKTIVIDDKLSIIGSANIDFRSLEHNFEVSTFIYDEPTAIEMRNIFIQDSRKCNRLTINRWNVRPRSQKIKESIVRFFSPLL